MEPSDWNPRLGNQSVAVLPFTYLAAEDSADYLSVGMTDEILTRLAQVEDLSVTGRTSVMRYQETDKAIRDIGRELGVAHVVEGSITLAGNQVRVQCQLLDSRTGEHIWSAGYTRRFENVIDLQVDLAREIAEGVKGSLLPETQRRLAEGRPVDSTAYRLYLRGRELRFRETDQSLTEAVRLLRRSVAIDSTFAPAWAVLSTCAWLAERFPGAAPADGLDGYTLGREAARRALELDSTSAEALVAMGNVHELLNHDFPSAGSYFQRAVRLNPGMANANREFGLYLMRMGQFELAEPYLLKAVRLDPVSAVAARDLGHAYLNWGRFERAKRYLKRALQLRPEASGIQRRLWTAYVAQDSARAVIPEMRREGAFALLGWTYGRTGRPDSARTVLRLIREESSRPFWRSLEEAQVFIGLGETDRAFDRLKAIGFHRTHSYQYKAYYLFRPLRKEPAGQSAIERWGLDEATVRRTIEKLDPDPPDLSETALAAHPGASRSSQRY